MAARHPLLQAVRRGECTLNGFRNRDLRALFFACTANFLHEARRPSAWVSRKLGLLRAHGLITKITGTYRYQLTTAGRKAITAIPTALYRIPTHASGGIKILAGRKHFNG